MNTIEKKSKWVKGVSIVQLGALFWSFFKISPGSFGGGYAMIPIIEREIVEDRKWMTKDELSDILAIAQSAPGAIAMNTAIFIGYRISGVWGAIVSLLGILLPTFLIMILLSMFFLLIKDNEKIEAALLSIRTTVVALIVYAAYKIGKQSIVDYPSLVIAIVTLIVLYFFNDWVHPVFIILAGALIGILLTVKSVKKQQLQKQLEEYPSDYMI